MGAVRVEHWFNRRYGMRRRDVYLLRLPIGWQVLGRIGGAEGQEVTHFFDHEADARAMLKAMLDRTPHGEDNWAQMTAGRQNR